MNFEIQKRLYGHLILCDEGIPLATLSEILASYPKDSFIDAGIGWHYHMSLQKSLSIAIAHDRKAQQLWRYQIAEHIQNLPHELQWLHGLDVGQSSLAMFLHIRKQLGMPPLANPPSQHHINTIAFPLDCDDLGRCLRLCDHFDWHKHINLVASLSPVWNQISQVWEHLRTAEPEEQFMILVQATQRAHSHASSPMASRPFQLDKTS